MNRALVERIARALLYEGYILYPYRPSVKNRQRWTFGGLFPRSWCTANLCADAWLVRTECLVSGDPKTTVHGSVRFLHLTARRVAQRLTSSERTEVEEYRFVESLRVGDRLLQTWQEAVEREVALTAASLAELSAEPRRCEFRIPGGSDREPICDGNGTCVGALLRDRQALCGVVETSAVPVADGLFRLAVQVENHTPWDSAAAPDRDGALMGALVSTHTILGVSNGEFVSLLEPLELWRSHAADCKNVGTWPVLVGTNGERDTVLSSPIILYDYPQLAPESPGDLFDATEIDEILTLRIQTLTDDEKRVMAAVDERARSLLHRTESLTSEQLLGLHGTLRRITP